MSSTTAPTAPDVVIDLNSPQGVLDRMLTLGTVPCRLVWHNGCAHMVSGPSWSHDDHPHDRDRLHRASTLTCPQAIQEMLLWDFRDEVRASLATNPELSPEFIEHLALDDSELVRTTLAGHPLLHPLVQTWLVGDVSVAVRRRFASNPCLAGPIVTNLAYDEDAQVRTAIASSPCITPKAALRLIRDPSAQVRRLVISNPHCPPIPRRSVIAAA